MSGPRLKESSTFNLRLISTMTYDELRIFWREKQPDDIIRSLAYDYARGLIDECTSDAYEEYQLRWGKQKKRKSQIPGYLRRAQY